MIYYDAICGGFFASSIHGPRKLIVPDPDWTATDDAPDAPPATIEIDNPACKIPAGAIEISDADHAALMAAQSLGKIIVAGDGGVPVATDPVLTAVELWALQRTQARLSLTESDITILRCAEANVAVPDDWVTYRAALRAIVSAETGDPDDALPTRPAYPAGT